MKIILRDITTIKPYPGNPRVNDKAVEAVAASIREFGFRQPIVVDGDGVIIAGHTRHKAAVLIGMTEVPVHVATDLTPEAVLSSFPEDYRWVGTVYETQERIGNSVPPNFMRAIAEHVYERILAS